MIELELLNNMPYILKSALVKDSLYKFISPEIDLNDIDVINTLYFHVIDENDNTVGIILVKPFTKSCFHFHGGTYKQFRGNTKRYLSEILTILKASYPGIEFISYTLETNKLARKLLLNVGFVEKTTIYNGYPQGNLVLYAEK